MPDIQTLQDAGYKAIAAGRAIIDSFGGKPVPAEKMEEAKKHFAEALSIKDQIDTEAKALELQKAFEDLPDRRMPVAAAKPSDGEAKAQGEVEHKAFWNMLRLRRPANEAEAKAMQGFKALRESNDPDGGYTVIPSISKDIMLKLVNLCHIRANATVETISTSSYEDLSLDYSDEADWGTETGTVDEEAVANVLGKRTFIVHPCTKLFKVSKDLLADNAYNLEAKMLEFYSNVYAQTEEKAFIQGSGVGRPLGLTKATLTSCDLTTGSAYTVKDFDKIIYAIKAQYRRSPSCAWILSRANIQAIMQLQVKTYNGSTLADNGQLLFQPSMQAGQPALLRGFPVLETEYMPTASTDGDCVGIFGDLKYYKIVDRQGIEIQILREKYAETRQMGYLMDRRLDGAPTNSEALVRVNRN